MQEIRELKDIKTAPFIREITDTASNMYRQGWDERNGGKISYLLTEDEIKDYVDVNKVIRKIGLAGVNDSDFDISPLIGKYFLVTGTGKYLKNIKDDPENNLGLFRIDESGKSVDLLWGYRDGGRFTSEFPAHMMSHIERLKINKNQRVVIHCHPTNLLAMTYVHPLDDASFTHTLWEMGTECIVVFPDGIGVLPWMLCGTDEIGRATAEKMKKSRIVVWSQHGIYASGTTLDETFGLIETVEKAAQIYNIIGQRPRINTITEDGFKQLLDLFHIEDARTEFFKEKK